jgi:glycosyltransferase involved in cell wall biosynthesis
MKLVKPIPAHLLESAQDATEFSEIVTAHGLSSYFEFLGHISDPERVLMESHVLIKPTRENNPWGRDILEAMAAGLPVVSVGTYSRFVEKDVTGLLQSRFDAKGVACFLMHLLANPDRRAGMGVSARDRVASLCDPTKHAEMLTELWTNVSTGNVVPPISRIRFGAVMPAYSAGGSELVLTSLVSGLDAEEFETRLFVISDAGRLNVDLSKIGFVHTLGIARLRNALFPLWRMLRGFRREVVFSSQVHLNICVLALGRLIPGMKIVVREANMPSDCLRNGHWPCLYRPLYRWALRRANCVMASSEMMRADMVKTFGVPDSKLMVLYNPVDVNDLRLRAKTPKRHPGPGRRFVAVGRLVRQKGFDRAIEWMAQMPSEDHLTILGEGEARDVLAMEIAQKKLQDRITLVGFVESPAAWVAGADALIMTSRWEGMPNAALEALAVGTPVIATPESGAIVEVASMASSGTVCVASDFCAAMRAVEVKPCSHPRPSLLPDAFSVGEVTDSFKRVLKTLCSNPTRPGV